MSTYLIGDVHGCYDELIALLEQVEFNPETDTLWLTGDLVARGPGSLEVLRFVKQLGDSVRLVLGNHDLHLLAVFAGISRNKPKDRLKSLLEAPDADDLLNWLRRQPMMQIDEEKKLVMAHAGITPQWDLETAKQCARDVDHYIKLRQAGVEAPERETFEAALKSGRMTLEALGLGAYEARERADLFRRFNLQMVEEMVAMAENDAASRVAVFKRT
ncbi:bis(5'-nucleosyl)-tetraphosphatase (symmetrical) ApaH, partial [Klebsiella michiganensis]